MGRYPLLAAIGLALAAIVLSIAYVRARRVRDRVDFLHVCEEVGHLLSTAEEHALTVATLVLTGSLGYTSFLGASLLHSPERPAMQFLVVASAVAVFDAYRRLAARPKQGERRNNKALFLLVLPFCLVSISFASFEIYTALVSGDLVKREAQAWQDYYHDGRTTIVTQANVLRNAAAAYYSDVSAKILLFQDQVYAARLENRPFLESPEQTALGPAEKLAAEWKSSLLDFVPPPPAPAPDRQKAEADLANGVEAINRLAAAAPPPLALPGMQIGRYVAASTDPVVRALEAWKRGDPPALYCLAVCSVLELFPLAALWMLHGRWYLHEFIKELRQSIVMVRRSLQGGVPDAGVVRTPEEYQAIVVVFRPEVHPGVRIVWNRRQPLARLTFGEVYPDILPKVESQLSEAGYRLELFVNADRMPMAYDLPVLAQLNGGVLVALCERIHPAT